MKIAAAVLLLVSACCAHASDSGVIVTNLVLTPEEVDPKSVRLVGRDPLWNLTFTFVGKTPEQVKAMVWTHAPVHVMKGGVVMAKSDGCGGYVGHVNPIGRRDFDGLVLVFHEHEQARTAEEVLKGEDKKPQQPTKPKSINLDPNM